MPSLFSIVDLTRLALANLRVNKFRSFLTVLSMVFGTGAVIATLSSHEGASAYIQQELKKLGANIMTIAPDSSNAPQLSEREMRLLMTYSTLFEKMGIVREVDQVGIRSGAKMVNGPLLGVTSDYFEMTRSAIERGRPFSDVENTDLRSYALIGGSLKKELFGNENAINKFIHLYVSESIFSLQVVGILKERGGAAQRLDRALYLPSSLVGKLANESQLSVYLLASLLNDDRSSKARTQIVALLKLRFPEGLRISDAREAIERTKGIWEKQNLVGFLLALISLLTGGVGIMNIMLLSVNQRRKEVGIRKAVGTQDTHILLQFLLEAVAVCLFGGILGCALGSLFGSQMAALLGQWQAVTSPKTILMALIFATLTGVLFGLLPAYRASKLDPYEALRT